MGCFNNTCGLSNLPIMRGDTVYIFPLMENYGDNYCHTSAVWKPVMTPFIADYDDYGAGENCRGVSLPFFMLGIKKNLVEMAVGENEHRDIEIKRDNFKIRDFFKACHRNRLKVKSYGVSDKAINFSMVRKDVVDKFWSEYKFRKYTGMGKGIDLLSDYDTDLSYDKLSQYIPSLLDKYFEHIKTYDGSNDDLIERSIPNGTPEEKLRMHNILVRMVHSSDGITLPYETDHPLKISFKMDKTHQYDIFEFAETVISIYDGGDRNMASDVMKNYFIGVCVDSYMRSLRKVWLPSMHQGSQSTGYGCHRFMSKTVVEIMDERNKNY